MFASGSACASILLRPGSFDNVILTVTISYD